MFLGGRFAGGAAFIPPGTGDQDDGKEDDKDHACGIFLMGKRIVSDDGLDAGGREFADKRGDDIVAEAHGRKRTDGVEHDGREIWYHAGDEHDDKAAFAAVLVEIGKGFVLADDLLGCVAEEEAQQDETDGNADSLSDD